MVLVHIQWIFPSANEFPCGYSMDLAMDLAMDLSFSEEVEAFARAGPPEKGGVPTGTSENSSFWGLSFGIDFWLIWVPFWSHFGSNFDNFYINLSSIVFACFFLRFWITFWTLQISKSMFFHTFCKTTLSRKTRYRYHF